MANTTTEAGGHFRCYHCCRLPLPSTSLRPAQLRSSSQSMSRCKSESSLNTSMEEKARRNKHRASRSRESLLHDRAMGFPRRSKYRSATNLLLLVLVLSSRSTIGRKLRMLFFRKDIRATVGNFGSTSNKIFSKWSSVMEQV